MEVLKSFLSDRHVRSLLKWVAIMLFFALVPPIFLWFAGFALHNLSNGVGADRFVDDFRSDMPMIMLAFWAGTMGSIIAYLNDRLDKTRNTQATIYQMSYFLFGGLLGATSYFVLRSAFLVKIMYPKIKLDGVNADELIDYRPLVALAVVTGLLAPILVARLRKKASQP